jgi:hypothetical protein
MLPPRTDHRDRLSSGPPASWMACSTSRRQRLRDGGRSRNIAGWREKVERCLRTINSASVLSSAARRRRAGWSANRSPDHRGEARRPGRPAPSRTSAARRVRSAGFQPASGSRALDLGGQAWPRPRPCSKVRGQHTRGLLGEPRPSQTSPSQPPSLASRAGRRCRALP